MTKLRAALLAGVALAGSTLAQAQIITNNTIPPGGSSSTSGSLPTVSTSAILTASSTSQFPNGVLETGYYQQGDMPITYYFPSATCPWSTGADTGSCKPSADGKFFVLGLGPNVAAAPMTASTQIFGAHCRGNTTDADDVPTNAALNWAQQSGTHIMTPGSVCHLTSTVVVPLGVSFGGSAFNASEDTTGCTGTPALNCVNGPTGGSRLQAALSLSTVVELFAPNVGSSTQGGQYVHDLAITRDAGSIPDNSTCLLDVSFKTTVERVNCNSHYNQFVHFGQINTGTMLGYGLFSHYNHLYAVNTTGSDLVSNGQAQWMVSDSTFGGNGQRNLNFKHANYVLNTGGGVGGFGPNTLSLVNNHFNDGSYNPTCAFNWSQLNTAYPQVTEFRFIANHMEITGQPGVPHALVCSDPTATTLDDVHWTDNTFVDFNGNSNAFNFNAATTLQRWHWAGTTWGGFLISSGGTWALNNTATDWTEYGDNFNGPTPVFNGQTGSRVVVDGAFASGLTVTGTFSSAKFGGSLAGALTYSGITQPQAVQWDFPGIDVSFAYTPTITCTGGAPVVSPTPVITYFRDGPIMNLDGTITITGIGTCTGSGLTITLPAPAATRGPLVMRENTGGVGWFLDVGAGNAFGAASPMTGASSAVPSAAVFSLKTSYRVQ